MAANSDDGDKANTSGCRCRAVDMDSEADRLRHRASGVGRGCRMDRSARRKDCMDRRLSLRCPNRHPDTTVVLREDSTVGSCRWIAFDFAVSAVERRTAVHRVVESQSRRCPNPPHFETASGCHQMVGIDTADKTDLLRCPSLRHLRTFACTFDRCHWIQGES